MMQETKTRLAYFAVIVFVIALMVRLMVVFTVNKDYCHGDFFSFHTLAVNIVKGNGYSAYSSPPFLPHFFRDPGYPAFLAGTYFVWEFLGGNINYLTDYEPENERFRQPHPEIQFAKCVQAAVGALTVTFIFLSLNLVLRSRIAFVLALAPAVYYPLALHSTYLWRENFLTLVVTVMAYCFGRYLFKNGLAWLLAVGVLSGVAMSTFQGAILLPAIIFLFSAIWFKSAKQAVCGTLVVAAIAFLCCVPWTLRAYSHFHTWKVAKTIGVSLTYEWLAAASAIRRAESYGLFQSGKEFDQTFKREMYPTGYFEKSFNGHYLRVADTWNAKLPKVEILTQRKLYKRAHYLIRSLVKTNWDPVKVIPFRSGLFEMARGENYLGIVLYCVSVIVGGGALIGLYVWYRSLFPILASYAYFIGLFSFLGGYERRFLPSHYFMIVLACLGIFYLFSRVVQRRTKEEIISGFVRPTAFQISKHG